MLTSRKMAQCSRFRTKYHNKGANYDRIGVVDQSVETSK